MEKQITITDIIVALLPYVIPILGTIAWAIVTMYFNSKRDSKDINELFQEIEIMKKDMSEHKNETLTEFKITNSKMNDVEKSLVEIKTMLQILLGQKTNGKS